MESKIYIDPEQIKKIMARPKDAGITAFKYLATEAWGNIIKEAPVDHGRLSGSFQLNKVNHFKYIIHSGVEYALAVATGTGIYGPKGQMIHIEARTKQCLHFVWQGMEIFAKSVNVKGQKANPYDKRAFEKAEKRVDEFITRALREMGE